jgi:hypothetical protein
MGEERVKPLEWEERTRNAIPYGPAIMIFRASTAFDWGYRIEVIDGDYRLEGVFYSTLEEAKAEAQADYEQRILSALATPPASGLREALERIQEKAKLGMCHGLTADATCEEIAGIADAALNAEGK